MIVLRVRLHSGTRLLSSNQIRRFGIVLYINRVACNTKMCLPNSNVTTYIHSYLCRHIIGYERNRMGPDMTHVYALSGIQTGVPRPT